MNEDLQHALWQAEGLPQGKARSRALEAVAQRADGVDLDASFAARIELAHSYVMGGERRKMLVPFAWCVAEMDKDPARFAEFEHHLLWAFKYVPSTLVRFPEVSLEMTRSTLEDMERRFRIAGKSQHAVHSSKHMVARHVGDEEVAAEEFRLWLAAPRDDVSDCLGCDPSSQVEYLAGRGRHDEAVALARPVLSGVMTCSEQPQEMQALALQSFVAEGLLEEAAQSHRAGYRRHRGRARHLGPIACHVRFCALTGNEARALEIVDTHLPLIDDADSTLVRMEFAAAASRALSGIARQDADLTVRTRDGRVEVGQAAADLAELATTLSEQFDARNGTSHQGDVIRDLLDEEQWAEFVPLSQTAERAHRARQRMKARREAESAGRRSDREEPGLPEIADVPDDELLEAAEQAWSSRRPDRAAALWDAYDAAVPADRRTGLDVARMSESAGLRAWAGGDLDAALEALQVALVGFDEAGAAERSVRARARLAGVLLDRGEVDDAVATGESPMRTMLETDAPERRPTWALRLARLLLAAQRAEEADAVLGSVELTTLDDDDRPAALFLAGEVAAELGRHEEAVDHFSAITEVVDDGPAHIMPLWQRGRSHLALGAASSAVEDLAEAVALLSTVDQLNPSLQGDLAEAYLRAEDPESAAQAVEDVLVVVGQEDLVPPTARLVDLLVRAAEGMGDWEVAVDAVRRLQAFAVEHGEPGWRLHLADREATFLEHLDRYDDATASWIAGAGIADAAGWQVDRARFLRCAASTAGWGGDQQRGVTLLDEAAGALAGLDPAEPEVRFHEAGIAIQRAEIALAAGRQQDAQRLAVDAEQGFLALGESGAAAGALLLRLDAGDAVPVPDLRRRWEELEPDTSRWYHLGYRIVDTLRDEGATAEADALEARLQGE